MKFLFLLFLFKDNDLGSDLRPFPFCFFFFRFSIFLEFLEITVANIVIF